jgi:hypothetical protein
MLFGAPKKRLTQPSLVKISIVFLCLFSGKDGVSDYVPDVVMLSLKTRKMNCRGPLRGNGGELVVGGGQFITNQE